jgi:hypothetical protein
MVAIRQVSFEKSDGEDCESFPAISTMNRREARDGSHASGHGYSHDERCIVQRVQLVVPANLPWQICHTAAKKLTLGHSLILYGDKYAS